jgi:hypothetical protein
MKTSLLWKPALIALVLAASVPRDMGAEHRPTEQKLKRGLVICAVDSTGETFFRRGECPSKFFKDHMPVYSTETGIDGKAHKNFCDVTNLQTGFSRVRVPGDLLCWDTNCDLQCDLENEDLNHDKTCDILDCQGKCWDLNRNGRCDKATEDLNGDGDCTELDCNVQTHLTSPGVEGSIEPIDNPTGRATIHILLRPGSYDITAAFRLTHLAPGEVVTCRILDGASFDSSPRLAQDLLIMADGDAEMSALAVQIGFNATVALRCGSSLSSSAAVLQGHSVRGLRLTVDRLGAEP